MLNSNNHMLNLLCGRGCDRRDLLHAAVPASNPASKCPSLAQQFGSTAGNQWGSPLAQWLNHTNHQHKMRWFGAVLTTKHIIYSGIPASPRRIKSPNAQAQVLLQLGKDTGFPLGSSFPHNPHLRALRLSWGVLRLEPDVFLFQPPCSISNHQPPCSISNHHEVARHLQMFQCHLL